MKYLKASTTYVSSPRNEYLNLLVRIKFLNWFYIPGIYLNKNWKIYWYNQSFTGLGPENRCSSRGLSLVHGVDCWLVWNWRPIFDIDIKKFHLHWFILVFFFLVFNWFDEISCSVAFKTLIFSFLSIELQNGYKDIWMHHSRMALSCSILS